MKLKALLSGEDGLSRPVRRILVKEIRARMARGMTEVKATRAVLEKYQAIVEEDLESTLKASGQNRQQAIDDDDDFDFPDIRLQ